MNFLIDAQLPRRLAHWLHEAGHDGAHNRDLPLGHRTPDSAVNEISLRVRRVVVTKDDRLCRFFYDSPSAVQTDCLRSDG